MILSLKYGTKKSYLSLEHDAETLYFCYDTEEVFCGDEPVFDYLRRNFLGVIKWSWNEENTCKN